MRWMIWQLRGCLRNRTSVAKPSPAMALLERHLRANTDRLGESRQDENSRVLIVEPLGVEFAVSVPDRMVTVFHAVASAASVSEKFKLQLTPQNTTSRNVI